MERDRIKFVELGNQIQAARKELKLKDARLNTYKYNTVAKRKAELAKLRILLQERSKAKAANKPFVRFRKLASKYGIRVSASKIGRMYKARKAEDKKAFMRAAGNIPFPVLVQLYEATDFVALSEQGQAMEHFIKRHTNPVSASVGALVVAGLIGYCFGKSE